LRYWYTTKSTQEYTAVPPKYTAVPPKIHSCSSKNTQLFLQQYTAVPSTIRQLSHESLPVSKVHDL